MAIDIQTYLPRLLEDTADRLNTLTHILKLPNCDTCAKRRCKYRPEQGYTIRYNCPLWKKGVKK